MTQPSIDFLADLGDQARSYRDSIQEGSAERQHIDNVVYSIEHAATALERVGLHEVWTADRAVAALTDAGIADVTIVVDGDRRSARVDADQRQVMVTPAACVQADPGYFVTVRHPQAPASTAITTYADDDDDLVTTVRGLTKPVPVPPTSGTVTHPGPTAGD